MTSAGSNGSSDVSSQWNVLNSRLLLSSNASFSSVLEPWWIKAEIPLHWCQAWQISEYHLMRDQFQLQAWQTAECLPRCSQLQVWHLWECHPRLCWHEPWPFCESPAMHQRLLVVHKHDFHHCWISLCSGCSNKNSDYVSEFLRMEKKNANSESVSLVLELVYSTLIHAVWQDLPICHVVI